MLAADIVTLLIPVFILVGLLLALLALNLLARVDNGRYVPELANAIAKLERSGVQNDPQRAQAAMSRLSAAERRAYLDAAGAEGAIPEPMNRQQRRQAQKLKKRR